MLIGSNDRQTYARGHLRVTIHHCWFDGHSRFYDAVDGVTCNLTQRMPRVRFGDVHVYNNYYEQIASYCIAARLESDVVAEYNYFRNLQNPHIIEDEGRGLEDPDLVARGNIYENVKGRKDENGEAFDPLEHYSWRCDDVETVPALVMNGAGKWDREGNHPPIVLDDVYRVSDRKESLKPLDNDSDPDGDAIRISRILNDPAGETLVYPDSIIYYRPDDAEPSDTIAYEVIDFEGGVSAGWIEIINEK
jgi:hypothetical protein